MEQNVQNWSQTTKNIFNAVLLFSLGSIVAGFISGIATAVGIGNAFNGNDGVSFADVLSWLLELAVAAGYVLYMLQLGTLRTQVGEKDGAAVGQVRTAAILAIVAAILAIFPVLNLLTGIVNIVAYIMMLVGFNTLRKSMELSGKARQGFSQLFVATLLNIIAVGLSILFGWIPVIGIVIALIAGILGIIAFIMVITGWSTVKNSPAPIA